MGYLCHVTRDELAWTVVWHIARTQFTWRDSGRAYLLFRIAYFFSVYFFEIKVNKITKKASKTFWVGLPVVPVEFWFPRGRFIACPSNIIRIFLCILNIYVTIAQLIFFLMLYFCWITSFNIILSWVAALFAHLLRYEFTISLLISLAIDR